MSRSCRATAQAVKARRQGRGGSSTKGGNTGPRKMPKQERRERYALKAEQVRSVEDKRVRQAARAMGSPSYSGRK